MEIKNLITKSLDALSTRGHHPTTILRYRKTWTELERFMASQNVSTYSPVIGKTFLSEIISNKPISSLSASKKDKRRHIKVLNDVLKTGKIGEGDYDRLSYDFPGHTGNIFREYIAILRPVMSPATIRNYERNLNYLYEFLTVLHLDSCQLTASLITTFFTHLAAKTTLRNCNGISYSIKSFVFYLCDSKLLNNNNKDYWCPLFRFSRPIRKLPSVYTKEEVEQILHCIDRSTAIGKRDYAICLIAARFGIRASDIVHLKFKNIDWENNLIEIVQEKTKVPNRFPLSEEIGMALIDYIQYGRSNSDVPEIFLTCTNPVRSMDPKSLPCIITKHMRIAGIKINGRKHGPHAFRHSMASNLLSLNETLPVISEILGHQSTRSTSTYIKVNDQALSACALEVPPVRNLFYEEIYE